MGAVKAVGSFTRLNKELMKGTTFTDTSLDLSRPQAVEGEALFATRFRPDQLDAKGRAYRFGVFGKPRAAAPYPFSTRQYSRLPVLRGRVQDGLLGVDDRAA